MEPGHALDRRGFLYSTLSSPPSIGIWPPVVVEKVSLHSSATMVATRAEVTSAPSKFRVMYSSTGGDIEIEDRGAEEVVSVGGSEIAPRGTGVMNPAFDVTSVGLITAIVTDRRVIRLDRGETLATVSSGPTGTLRG